jgi:transcriptional antiterminator RfaH
MSTTQPWFALQTKSRSEKKTGYLLEQKGFECLTPTYRLRRKWSDRVVEIDWPLFPMYVFCHFNASALGQVLSTPGVIKIVGFGGKPAEVAMEEIEDLRLLLRTNCLREPWKYIPHGTRVLIENGPLTGTQGIICQDDKSRRLVISVTLLQRAVAVQLDESTMISIIPDSNGGNKSGLASEIACGLLRRTGAGPRYSQSA